MEKLAQRSHFRLDTLGAGECLRSLCGGTLGGTLRDLFRDAVYLLGGLLRDFFRCFCGNAQHFVGFEPRREITRHWWAVTPSGGSARGYVPPRCPAKP